MMKTSETALNILAQVSGKAVPDVLPEMHLVRDLGIDSPKSLELLMELENAFAIEIEDVDAASMETVGDVLAYVGQLG